MAVHGLETLCRPTSVAVVGASHEPGAIGHIVLANLIAGGFAGPIYAVNPRRIVVPGSIWCASVDTLPAAPDLAVIAVPPASVPDVVRALGRLGTRVAVILTNGFGEASHRAALAAAGRESGIRLVGPNSLGMLLPGISLNATFAPQGALPGRLAFLSQSGALVTAMLDWAADRHVGFSAMVSMGDMVDVDWAEMIAFYAADPETAAILLYIEGIGDAARFMSAACAATRLKPVVAIKAGRSAASGQAAMSHTGAMTGAYDVHAAAFRRAGMILVDSMTELFDAAEILGRGSRPCGPRVGIVTNGGGAGVLAADALPAAGAELAKLAPETVSLLDRVLPKGWSRANPADVVGDACADRFDAAVRQLLADPGVDALLVLHCPTAVETGVAMATAALHAAAGSSKPVIGAWLGPSDAASARPLFDAAGVPLFDTVEGAVRGLGYLRQVTLARAQASPNRPSAGSPEHNHAAAAIVATVRGDGRCALSATEARALLAAYGIPTVTARVAADPAGVAAACAGVAAPYVVKIVSPQLSHKSDAGGVVTNLPDAAAAVTAGTLMQRRIMREHPEAQIAGFEIEPMIVERNGVELIVGVAEDSVFGPVIAVGAGGKAVEVIRDRALDLPPLDDDLARAMIARTRIAALLAGYRDVPPYDLDGVVAVIRAVATMVEDFPDIVELDINPLLVGQARVTALDVRIRISDAPRASRMAIRPMPEDCTTPRPSPSQSLSDRPATP
ncbi:MAG: acetate--CoA ligase family protein [Pseudomonadota bacterium]